VGLTSFLRIPAFDTEVIPPFRATANYKTFLTRLLPSFSLVVQRRDRSNCASVHLGRDAYRSAPLNAHTLRSCRQSGWGMYLHTSLPSWCPAI